MLSLHLKPPPHKLPAHRVQLIAASFVVANVGQFVRVAHQVEQQLAAVIGDAVFVGMRSHGFVRGVERVAVLDIRRAPLALRSSLQQRPQRPALHDRRDLDTAIVEYRWREIHALDPGLPILLMTAWTSLDTAVQLVKEGASDYLGKPWDDEKLVDSVRSLHEHRKSALADAEVPAGAPARCALASRHDLCGIVYASDAMHDALRLALRVAAAEVPVLVTGPNGAGKEMVAKIVQANSRRRSGPFICVNSGALPENLLESELFGSEDGAFTGAKSRVGRFEAAHGGTIFLDEIGNMSPGGQMKLLRVLQTGEFERVGSSTTRKVDVRVIAATNTDLERAIAEGTFREDLYFRLNVIEIPVPPLAERRDDVLPLAHHFFGEIGQRERRPLELDGAARAALVAHDWPGNVRELYNCIQRAALLAPSDVVRAADLGLRTRGASHPEAAAPAAATSPTNRGTTLQDTERARIEEALTQAGGVVSKAAAELGVSRQALYRRMERYGVRIKRSFESDS